MQAGLASRCVQSAARIEDALRVATVSPAAPPAAACWRLWSVCAAAAALSPTPTLLPSAFIFLSCSASAARSASSSCRVQHVTTGCVSV